VISQIINCNADFGCSIEAGIQIAKTFGEKKQHLKAAPVMILKDAL